MYPEYIEVNGNKYKINTDYRVALACYRAIQDTTLSEINRFYTLIWLLIDGEVKAQDELKVMDKIAIYLRCGAEENTPSEEITFDYLQDEQKVEVSFKSEYPSIDLSKPMHWWEYNALIEGLSPDSYINRVRNIRGFDLNEEKDYKRREAIRKAKESVKLKGQKRVYTKEEQDIIDSIYGKE